MKIRPWCVVTCSLQSRTPTIMDKVETAVGEWDTNIRLFVVANGEAPTEEAKRMALIEMLPLDISAYISMHEGMEAYRTIPGLKRFVF